MMILSNLAILISSTNSKQKLPGIPRIFSKDIEIMQKNTKIFHNIPNDPETFVNITRDPFQTKN